MSVEYNTYVLYMFINIVFFIKKNIAMSNISNEILTLKLLVLTKKKVQRTQKIKNKQKKRKVRVIPTDPFEKEKFSKKFSKPIAIWDE